MAEMQEYIRWFDEITIKDVPLVGGKSASLGEMYQKLRRKGVPIPYGFALTAKAYDFFLAENRLTAPITKILSGLDTHNALALQGVGAKVREHILKAQMPSLLVLQLASAYKNLSTKLGVKNPSVAVRSSATAEDLPQASFAGQQESYLNITGADALVESVQKCFASLFSDRAISYRVDQGFDHMEVSLSVCIQKMVRSDLSSAGVIFTADPESGNTNVLVIHSSYGLGESVVKGRVNPDEFMVFKPLLGRSTMPIIERRLGAKAEKLIYSSTKNAKGTKGKASVSNTTLRVPVEPAARHKLTLTDTEVEELAKFGVKIERHYKKPMDIEWAKDGKNGRLYIVQARPMTGEWLEAKQHLETELYTVRTAEKPLVTGWAVGRKVGVGVARYIKDATELKKFKKNEILVTRMTDPDWEPIMKSASAIVTDEGGKTCHAAIVSRELGIPCVVGTKTATKIVADRHTVTVSCAEGEIGKVYSGKVDVQKRTVKLSALPKLKCKLMLNIGDPETALHHHALPVDGVGLARMEFVLANHVKIHPLAALAYPKLPVKVMDEVELLCKGEAPEKYFVRVLSEGISKIAAAFYPRPVILRFSDFKSNEYKELLGGSLFEVTEANPMIGFRGAVRYYSKLFASAFGLECEAVKYVRETMGLDNLQVMIPFCRTPEELIAVRRIMTQNKLSRQSRDKGSRVKVYVMAELPSNIILAEEFAKNADGFSIGTNDLTQLIFGLDRDSEAVAHLYSDSSEAVKRSIHELIAKAHKADKTVSICGEAPSNNLDFAKWLVDEGIDAISLEADSIIPFLLKLAE